MTAVATACATAMAHAAAMATGLEETAQSAPPLLVEGVRRALIRVPPCESLTPCKPPVVFCDGPLLQWLAAASTFLQQSDSQTVLLVSTAFCFAGQVSMAHASASVNAQLLVLAHTQMTAPSMLVMRVTPPRY